MERLLWISLAGAAGTAARYLITIAFAQRFGSTLPYGTLVVNLTGCFAIAALVPTGAALGWSPTVRTALTVGFLGGFTTYSSFNYETMRLWESDATAASVDRRRADGGRRSASPAGWVFSSDVSLSAHTSETLVLGWISLSKASTAELAENAEQTPASLRAQHPQR